MMTHLDDLMLSDLADNVLDGEARARADLHLAACDECFTRLARLRRLLAEAGALPSELPVPPDEWARVRARITPEPSSGAGRSPWWVRRGSLIAAGIALVVVSSATTALLLDRGPAPSAAVVPATTPVLATRLASIEHDYASVTRDLERELAEHRHVLSPETIAAVERSLRTIDAAIAEAREALARDPGSETVARLLVASHDQKIELLRRANRWATQG